MPRLIDADALGIGKCNPDVFENKGYASGWNAAIDLINAAPTIDAVPVVRCRECEMASPCSDEREIYCTMYHSYKRKIITVQMGAERTVMCSGAI